MSRDVVLIPAWQRPEFLWHCLANLKRCEGADQLHYIFWFDQDHTPELHEVIKDFPFSHEVQSPQRKGWRDSKQSYAVLMGYRYAASKARQFVFMVEEDVMVRTDFFQYHYAVHGQNPGLFCSIAVANPNRVLVDSGSNEQYYLSGGDYCSLGVCYRAAVLQTLVDPHANTTYFLNMPDYCKRHFPTSPFGYSFAEQDGLIRRVQWSLAKLYPIAYPWTPRAYHAGLYGKNRGKGPAGSFAARLKYVTEVIYSDEAMRTFAKHPEWYEDSRPIDLQAPPWTNTMHLLPIDPARNPLRA